MPRKFFVALFMACSLTNQASRLRAGVIDSINPNATPATNLSVGVDFQLPGNDIGWYYTPSFSYELTGIATDFGPTDSPPVTPQITMQIQTDRPVNGGTVLAQGTFQGNSESGGIESITFAPIPLTAGKSYFIDLQGINGMGVDLGTWQNVSGSPEPAGGATINLGTDYSDSATSSGFPVVSGNGDYGVSTDGVNVAGGEPILFFSGSVPGVPEPSSIVLCGSAAIGLLAFRRRSASRIRSRSSRAFFWQRRL